MFAFAPGHGDRMREPVEQKLAVRQLGQCIVACGLRDVFQRIGANVRMLLRAQRGQHQVLIRFQQLCGIAVLQSAFGRFDLQIELGEMRARLVHFGTDFILFCLQFGQRALGVRALRFDGGCLPQRRHRGVPRRRAIDHRHRRDCALAMPCGWAGRPIDLPVRRRDPRSEDPRRRY